MKRYGGATPWLQPSQQAQELAEVESATPARAADLVPDLLVPLAQALVTGAFLAGLVVFVLAEISPRFDGDLLRVWGFSALAISTVTWLILLGQTRRLLWAYEQWTGRDLDGNGKIGKPPERIVIINAGQGQREAAQQDEAAQLSQFARFVAALPARGTALRAWEAELGRDTYNEYRDALIRLGWARWNSMKADGTPNERQGWTLTLDAGEILRRISG